MRQSRLSLHLTSLGLVGALSSVAFALQAEARSSPVQQGVVESRFSSIWPQDCTVTGDGTAEDQDWVSYRCDGQGGVPVYLFFSDGVRLSLGFGDSSAPFIGYPANRERNWPIEWRGRMANGRFVPHAAILRMRTHPEEDGVTATSKLIVFGLAGRVCVLGETSGGRANEEARRLADTGRC